MAQVPGHEPRRRTADSWRAHRPAKVLAARRTGLPHDVTGLFSGSRVSLPQRCGDLTGRALRGDPGGLEPLLVAWCQHGTVERPQARIDEPRGAPDISRDLLCQPVGYRDACGGVAPEC